MGPIGPCTLGPLLQGASAARFNLSVRNSDADRIPSFTSHKEHTMNRFITSALLATSAALTGPAFADDFTPPDPFVSTADRAQVQAGVAEARSLPDPWSITYNPLAMFESDRT